MEHIVRGNRIHILAQVLLDPTWNAEDCARFATLRARYERQGQAIDTIRCMVWKSKVPGLMYPPEVEMMLSQQK